MSLTFFFVSKYLFQDHENYTLWRVMVWLHTPFSKSPSTSMALRQQGTSVCMPCQYHALSCSHSQVLTVWITSPSVSNFVLQIESFWDPNSWKSVGARLEQHCLTKFCDFFLCLQTWVQPCIFMLKKRLLLDFCEADLVWKSSEFCHYPDVGVRVYCLSSWHHIHKNHSCTVPEDSDCNLAYWQGQFFLSGRLRVVSFHAVPFFVSGSKWWAQVSAAVTIWDKKVSPTASKRANNLEELAILSVLCLTMGIPGTLLVHTFENPVSQMMWLTLPLLTERLSATCWIVKCQSSWMVASVHCSISGLTAVTGQPEQVKLWSVFLFQKPSLFTRQPTLLPQHFHKHAKMFVNVSHWFFQSNKESYPNMSFVLHIMTDSIVRCYCSGAVYQKSIQIHV